jgi:hypothetical protein
MKTVPADRTVWESEIASYWFEDGLLVSLSKPVERTVDNLSRNIELVREITQGKKVPLLIHLSKSPVPDRQAQRFSRERLATNYSAMAMVAKPGLAQFIMALLFKFNPPPIPMKSFADESSAKEWLRQFL